MCYFDSTRQELFNSEEAIQSRIIKASDLDSYLKNGVFMFRTPGTYKLISGMAAIPARTEWIINGDNYSYKSTVGLKRPYKEANLSTVFDCIKKYRKAFENKKIGVELSGGLDTSLIIESLRHLNIDISLMGFVSDRFEFRTERMIQEKYKSEIKNTICIPYEKCIPFCALPDAPLHPFPTGSSLLHHRQQLTADAAKQLGVDILLNGDAGDSLLCHDLSNFSSNHFLENYHRWMISDDWMNVHICKPIGISYISAFSLPAITRVFLKLRNGQKEDSKKMWARNYFKNILPFELSNYAYKASHDGWVANGLKTFSHDIYKICEVAYDIIRHPLIHPEKMTQSALGYEFSRHADQVQFLAKLSFATWVYSYNRDGLIAN